MENGNIGQESAHHEKLKIVVIDVELLISKKRKWVFWTEYFISDLNSAVTRYIRHNKSDVDEFEVCGVNDEGMLNEVLSTLQLRVSIKNFSTEKSYLNYLIGRNAFAHFGINERKNYSKQSILITRQSL